MPVGPIGVASISAPARTATGTAPRASFGAVLRRQSAPAAAAPTFSQAARAAVESVDRARRHLDLALADARRGRTFTAQELLALQTDAYRYSQLVDVASKVVEQGAQTVKQAVNTQV